LFRSESPSGKCAKLYTVAASNNKDHPRRSLYYCLFAPHTYMPWVSSSRIYPVRGESHVHCQLRGCNNIPFFLQRTAPITRSFCEGCTWNDLHIMVTAPLCCDQKAQVACVQSFTTWQQAAKEITRHVVSVIACLRHRYMDVVLHAHQRQQRGFNIYSKVGLHLWK